jgi:hypothetical protein
MGPRDDRPVDAEVGEHLAARLHRSRDRLVTPVDAEVARAHLAEIAAAAEFTARQRQAVSAPVEQLPGVWAARPRRGGLVARLRRRGPDAGLRRGGLVVGVRPGGSVAGLRVAAASGLAAMAAVFGLAIVGALPPTAAQAVAAAVGWMGVELPGTSGANDLADAAGTDAADDTATGERAGSGGPVAGALAGPHVLGPLPLPGLAGGAPDGPGRLLGRAGGLDGGDGIGDAEPGAAHERPPGERGAQADGTPSGPADRGAGPSDPGSTPAEPSPVEADPPGDVDGDTPGQRDEDRVRPTPPEPDRPARPDQPGQPGEAGRDRDRPEPPGRDGDGDAAERPSGTSRPDRSTTGSEPTGTGGGGAEGSGAVGD